MARKTRIEFAGAVYHLLDRGDRREAIYRDRTDRERFLATLALGHPGSVSRCVRAGAANQDAALAEPCWVRGRSLTFRPATEDAVATLAMSQNSSVDPFSPSRVG